MMAVNKYKNHLFVICEDLATFELGTAWLESERADPSRYQIPSPVRGWESAVESARELLEAALPTRHVLLIIDFDSSPSRSSFIRQSFQTSAKLFIIGVDPEAEDLRRLNFGHNWPLLGERMAKDRPTALANAGAPNSSPNNIWLHPRMLHNLPELRAFTKATADWLFPK